MGKYVNNGKVSLPTSQLDYDDAVREIALLLSVPKRNNRYHLGDVCVSSAINKWCKFKPFRLNQRTFASESERNQSRKTLVYGLDGNYTTQERNDLVMVYNWKNQSLDGVPKRLRDFNGYNHYAQGGVEIANKSQYGVTSNIELKTEQASADGVSLAELLEYFPVTFKSYQWTLIDPWGFIHFLQRYNSYDELSSKLNNSSYLTIVNIDDYRKTMSDWTQNVNKPIPFIPAYNGGQWIVSLAGITDSLLSSKPLINQRVLFNPFKLTDNRATQMGITTTLGISGYNANMIVGSIYQGKAPLYSLMYGDDAVLNCCVNDSIYLGFKIYQNLQDYFVYNPLYLEQTLEATIWVNGTKYSQRLFYYNGGTTASTISMLKGQLYGSGGVNSGNAWSEGTFFFNTSGFFSAFPNQTDLQITISVAMFGQTFQGVPFISFTIRNTGKYVSDITPQANHTSRT